MDATCPESPSQRDGERIAIIVVHGVGEAEPGECVRTLVETLGKQPGVAPSPTAKVASLVEMPDRETATERPAEPAHALNAASFPVFFHEAAVGNRSLTLAEVYWADLTRIRPGRFNTAMGLFQVIFEAHYVIDAMLHPRRGRAECILRAVLLWLSWFMRGPIAGLTVATAVMLWAAIYQRPSGVFTGQPWTFDVLLAVLVLGSLALRIWPRMSRNPTWRTSLNWTAALSAALLAVILTAPSSFAGALYYGAGFSRDSFETYVQTLLTAPPHFDTAEQFVTLAYRNLIRLWMLFSVVWVLGCPSSNALRQLAA
jgi:hypothetical protein